MPDAAIGLPSDHCDDGMIVYKGGATDKKYRGKFSFYRGGRINARETGWGAGANEGNTAGVHEQCAQLMPAYQIKLRCREKDN